MRVRDLFSKFFSSIKKIKLVVIVSFFSGVVVSLIIVLIIYNIYFHDFFIEGSSLVNSEKSIYIATINKNEYYLKDDDFSNTSRGIVDVYLKSGENLFSALLRENFDRNNVNDVINVLQGNIDFKNLIEGQFFEVTYYSHIEYEKKTQTYKNSFLPERFIRKEKKKLDRIYFKLKNGIKYTIERLGETYRLHIEKPNMFAKTHIVSGTISTSLFQDALIGDIRPSTLYNMLNEYAFLIDFQRDLHSGDKFIFVLDTIKDSDGDIVNEKILYSNLILRGQEYEIFNFNGKFFDRKGKSIQRMLLKTPIDGARITSRFNPRRRHPILGYTRAHMGVDMAAPTGTPIYAAGDGTISEVVVYDNSAYGKYVTIKHNREYSTRYAHMSRVAKIKIGQRIKQRQVIGYVGMTGLATGPHLHYEVIRNGVRINPSSMKIASIKNIEKQKIDEFNKVVENIDILLKSRE